MNVLFCSQSESLALFQSLRSALAARLPIDRAGFTVADSFAYQKWSRENPGFDDHPTIVLKEWEITARRSGKPDLAKLARYERDLGGAAGLFGAIVADRRLLMGKDCAYSQDYRRRFSDDELLCVLQAGIEEMERVFDDLKPSLLVGFICVTMLDYLAYLFARARGVRVLNLRPTRISDRVMFGSRLNDPDPTLVASYGRIRSGLQEGDVELARRLIKRVREEHGLYEGVVAPSDKPSLAVKTRGVSLGTVVRVASNYRSYLAGPARSDNHVPDPLRALAFAAVVNPARARQTRRFLASHFLSEGDLLRTRYAFFPLHTEPEVSLLVYGRPFLNQIEVIRALALSLPVDMVLIVKEHPWMVGKRTKNAYRKMLAIPRVRIVRSSLSARLLVQHADLVAVITGSVALEAAMLGKPVLTFGDCPYNLLPDTMVRRAVDLRQLPSTMADLLQNYQFDEHALESYVAAVFDTSASVNLYSVLLGKQQVHAERVGSYQGEVERLADYALKCVMAAPGDAGPLAPQGALW
jgi:hypothetical protein